MECSTESFKPELRLIKSLWGVDHIEDPSKWTHIFGRIKEDGF